MSVAIESPPLLPNARIEAGDNQVEVFWDDLSEWVTDPFTDAVDFESYRIWRVQDWLPPGDMDQDAAPPLERWGMIAEFDLVNTVYAVTDTSRTRPLPLGQNTGLEDIVYTPDCLDDPRFAGVAEAMQTLVDSDPYSLWITRPPVRRADGVRIIFNNLPAAHNTIRIFTLSGDLLQTIHHDGTTGSGSASWNLMTRNGQEIVSGLYLYAVHSDRKGFESFRGRFVVIR